MITTRFGAEFLMRAPGDAHASNLGDMRHEMEAARRSLAAWRRARLARALLPIAIADWLDARRKLRQERALAEALAGLSPHMLDDIGLRGFPMIPTGGMPLDRRG
jgi:hypothetical protein